MRPTLLDTNVLSELVRLKPNAQVERFLEVCEEPFLSAAVFHEIAYGIERMRDVVGKQKVEVFFRGVKQRFEGRVVAIDATIAEMSGRLRAAAANEGRALSQMDAMIAACAIGVSGRLATRNIRDFQWLGIDLVNPWND